MPPASISLLNVTQAHAESFCLGLKGSPFGYEITAKWRERKPVIREIRALPGPIATPVEHDLQELTLRISPGDCKHFQVQLKAFGNRLASQARRPVKFERVSRGNVVHIAAAYHHLAACGIHGLQDICERDVNCVECILAALTPPATYMQPEFHPHGRFRIRDSELMHLRDQALNLT